MICLTSWSVPGLSSPFFLPPIHFLAPHVNISTLVHPRSKSWYLALVTSPLRHRRLPATLLDARAPGRTISIPFLGKIAPQANIVRVSERPVGTIVGIIRSHLRHLSR